MATSTCTILFPIEKCDVPSRVITLDDDEASGLMNGYAESAYFSCRASRGAFVESWILERIHRLPGLGYFSKVSACLGDVDIRSALRDIELAFGFIRCTEDSDWYNGYRFPVSQALHVEDSMLDELISEDGDDPYNLISYLREHRSILSFAMENTGYAMFFSYNPYRVFD